MLVDMELLLLATMPRVGSEYHAVEAKSASSSYRTTPRQNTSTNNMVELSSDDVSEDTEDEEDEAYNPLHGGWISEESDNNETYVNSDEVHVVAAEKEGMGLNDGQNAVEDEVHDDPEDTQSEEDKIDNGRAGRTRRGMPFVLDPSGRVRAKRRVLEKTEVVNCKSYSMLYTYGSIVLERNLGFMMNIKTATTEAGCMSFEGTEGGTETAVPPLVLESKPKLGPHGPGSSSPSKRIETNGSGTVANPRMSEMPKKNRKIGKEEPLKCRRSGGVRCKGCDEFGHNIRTYPRGAGSSSRRPKKV
ncbi:hypothetical protein ACOSQ3_006892 [Xanthoceras sorbifolium]